MLFAVLVIIAASLTCAMFATKNSMLGFPSAMFWAIAGGQAYTLSVAAWDIYFLIAFGCILGMTSFCIFAAYGLREKRDTLGDIAMEKGDGKYIDEGKKDKGEGKSDNFFEDDGMPDKANGNGGSNEGSKRHSRKRKGEFNF